MCSGYCYSRYYKYPIQTISVGGGIAILYSDAGIAMDNQVHASGRAGDPTNRIDGVVNNVNWKHDQLFELGDDIELDDMNKLKLKWKFTAEIEIQKEALT